MLGTQTRTRPASGSWLETCVKQAQEDAARVVRAELSPAWAPQHRRDCPRGMACQCPQVLAYHSRADVIGYGGAAGGGKTALLVGKAGTQHRRSIIFRRVFPSLRGMIEYSREVYARGNDDHSKDSYNEQLHLWRLTSGATIEFSSAQYEDDLKKFQGQPHDLLAFDEATEFPEKFVRFLMGWNRSTDPRARKVQTLLTFNPPMDDTGSWVVAFFGPWLDPQHPRPAQDGELRWYAMVDGKEVECVDGVPFERNGETIAPRSRTFFHARLSDNPALEDTGYGAQIDALPEPLRSLLRGNFEAGKVIDPMQLIKPEWVRLANERWEARKSEDRAPMSALGVDVSRGGDDKTVRAPVYGTFFDHLHKTPGVMVKDGPTAAALVIADLLGSRPQIAVDVIGYGSSCVDSLVLAGYDVIAVNFATRSDATDKSGRLHMLNERAAQWWAMREALDPENVGDIALPPDQELLADLCAPRWELAAGGKIKIEEKDKIKERLGRSPDCGDAVVMANYANLNSGEWFWG